MLMEKLRFRAILSTQKGTPGVPQSVSLYPGTFENPNLGTFDRMVLRKT